MAEQIKDPAKGWERTTIALAGGAFLPSSALLGYSDALRLQGHQIPEWASTFTTPEFLTSYGTDFVLFAASVGSMILTLETRKRKMAGEAIEFGLGQRTLYRSQAAVGLSAMLLGATYTGHSLLNHDAVGSILGVVGMIASDIFVSPNIQASKSITRVLRQHRSSRPRSSR